MSVAQISRHRRGDDAIAASEFHFLLVHADFINQQPQVLLGECLSVVSEFDVRTFMYFDGLS
jgi:hypothetical protein